MAGWRCKRVGGREGGREGGGKGAKFMRPHSWRLPLIASLFFKEKICTGHILFLLMAVMFC